MKNAGPREAKIDHSGMVIAVFLRLSHIESGRGFESYLTPPAIPLVCSVITENYSTLYFGDNYLHDLPFGYQVSGLVWSLASLVAHVQPYCQRNTRTPQ